MLISIRHLTSYTYADPVRYTIQSLRLTPAPFKGQRVSGWTVKVAGAGPLMTFRDGFGNMVHVATIATAHDRLTIEASGRVETSDTSGIVAGLAEPAPPRVYLRETPQTRPDGAIRELAASINSKDTLDRLHSLSRAVRNRVEYVPGVTDAHTGAAEALADGKGVCQDHAHIFIAAARTLGVPARYVTGYLVIDADRPSDAHHAWAEGFVEGLGWVGFDVANGISPTERYVRLAAGLDAGYAAPVIGSRRGGSAETLDVAVEVEQQQNAQQ